MVPGFLQAWSLELRSNGLISFIRPVKLVSQMLSGLNLLLLCSPTLKVESVQFQFPGEKLISNPCQWQYLKKCCHPLLVKVRAATVHAVYIIHIDCTSGVSSSYRFCIMFCVVVCSASSPFVFTSYPADHITSVPLSWPESPTNHGILHRE